MLEDPITQAETLKVNEAHNLQLNNVPADIGEMEQPLPSLQKPLQL